MEQCPLWHSVGCVPEPPPNTECGGHEKRWGAQASQVCFPQKSCFELPPGPPARSSRQCLSPCSCVHLGAQQLGLPSQPPTGSPTKRTGLQGSGCTPLNIAELQQGTVQTQHTLNPASCPFQGLPWVFCCHRKGVLVI